LTFRTCPRWAGFVPSLVELVSDRGQRHLHQRLGRQPHYLELSFEQDGLRESASTLYFIDQMSHDMRQSHDLHKRDFPSLFTEIGGVAGGCPKLGAHLDARCEALRLQSKSARTCNVDRILALDPDRL
jgi:hypothetical protein